MTADNPFGDPDFVRRTLTAYTQQLGALAAGFTAGPAGMWAGAEAWHSPLLAAYQQAFAPAGRDPGLPPRAAAGAAGQRLVRAGERLASLGADIASDAFARLSSRLADEAPGGAPPITSLAALHALWVECGDAAWQAGAGREEFAEAQAEYLSALAALGATARP